MAMAAYITDDLNGFPNRRQPAFSYNGSNNRCSAMLTSTQTHEHRSQVACWLRGARHVRFRHSYDFAMSSYILRNRLRIIGGSMAQVWLVTGSSRGLGRAI